VCAFFYTACAEQMEGKMNLSKYKHIVFSVATGSLLLVGLFLLLNGTSQLARADPGVLFVSPTGSGSVCSQSEPCALQTALSQANDGDTIYVAEGIYTGTGTAVMTLTKSITLYGGWDGTSTGPVVRDRDAYPTILDGEMARRVVYISEAITPTLDGFIISRGNATGLTANCHQVSGGNPDGCGGGIFVDSAHPMISNNVITNNIAAITTAGYPTSTTGYGGGLYLQYADRAVISGNLIISNTASTAFCGYGGGLHLHDYDSATGMRVEANQVLSNVATTKDVGCAWGGGIGGGPNGVLIQGNLVEGNRSNGAGRGYGAGLYQWYGSAEYRGNIVRRNQGDHAVYLGFSRSRFEGNQVVDNATNAGVYLTYGSGGGPTLVNNIVARSGSQWSLSAAASVNYPLTATLLHNTLVGAGSGNGVHTWSYVTLFLTNTIVVSHTWGITNTNPASSTVAADHTLFWANTNDGIRGTNQVDGDPRFVNLDGSDYHIAPGSAAIDAGVNAGVTSDIDGDTRPQESGYDIGADEFSSQQWDNYPLYLPSVVKNYP
jgi:putative cofactor-binding repeat protein